MALDTRIPLGVQQVDIASPLANLIQTRQVSQDRATAAQDRERQIARQATQDQQRNTEFNQNSQLNAAKIEEFRSNKATQQYMQDTLTVKNLLESNNPQDAALVVQGMQERFKGTDYASGLDQDLANITSGNLEPVLSGINSEIQVFQQMGKMTAPERQAMQKVAPGETLFDPNSNQAVFTAPARDTRDTARESRVQNIAQQLQSNMGMTPEQAMTEASNIADGNVTYEALESGQVRRIDRIRGEVSEVPIKGSGQQIPTPPAGRTLFELATQATGPVSAARAGLARIGVTDPAVLEGRTELRNAMQELSKALVVNDRFPVAEVERVRADTDLDPAIIDNAAAMQARMRGLESYLGRRQAQAERDANDPSLPQSIRDGQAANASTIRNFRAVMGVPARISADFLSTPESVRSVDSGSLKYFIENADDDDLNSLADSVVDEIITVVSGAR